MPVNPPIPPIYANVTAQRLYDKTAPEAVRLMYAQLEGMAAMAKSRTIQVTIGYLMEVTGKSQSSVYGCTAFMRDRGWLLFSRAHAGTLVLSLTDCEPAGDNFQNPGISKNLEILNTSPLINESLVNKEEGGNFQNSGNSKNLEIHAEKPGRKQKKTADERVNHPAIQAYKAEARLHVPISWRDAVISAVGDQESNVNRWRTLVHDWIGRGYNRQNVSGLLDAYKKGGLSSNGNGKNGHKPQLSETELAAKKAREQADIAEAMKYLRGDL